MLSPNILRTLIPHSSHRQPLRPSTLLSRRLSFATPDEAAAERRRRKRRLRMEPPLNSLRHSPPQQPQQRQPPSVTNPNSPKFPESVSVLAGNRLNLHNRILRLIRENDLDEAALLTRHSIYSNCRPTIFTINAVLLANLRQSRYSDLLSLHRFITQAGVAANIVTHNILINAYCDCRKTDTALEHYKQLIEEAPFDPSPTTYRILIKGLVDNCKLDRAIELKDEMLSKGFAADPTVFNYLMLGNARISNPDAIFSLYDELKEKMATFSNHHQGIVSGSLMKGYFLKDMEKDAMDCYNKAVGCSISGIRMNAASFNFILEALVKNGKFEEALNLFDKMRADHNPPYTLIVNLGSYNVLIDGYCDQGRFTEAIEVFRSMGEKRCKADTQSYNNLIEQLCKGGHLGEGEEVYRDMDKCGVKPDEFSHVILMNACFEEKNPKAAAEYFSKMVEIGLRPNLKVYNGFMEGLVGFGMVDEAKSFYNLMVKKLRLSTESYRFMMSELFKAGRTGGVLEMVKEMLESEDNDFIDELQEFVRGELRKEGREEEVVKLMEDREREKAEARAKEVAAAEAAKASARAAVASLIPSKLFPSSNGGNEEGDVEESIGNLKTPVWEELISGKKTETGGGGGGDVEVKPEAEVAVEEMKLSE